MHKFNSVKSKPVYIGIIAGLLFTYLLGCFKQTAKYTPNAPLTVTGTVTGNTGSLVWFDTIGHQVYEYNLCSGPNLLSKGEGGSINFSWNPTNECYVEESATHQIDLDTKD